MLLFAHAASVSSSSHLTFHRSSIEEEDCHGSTKKKSASTYRWMTSKDMTQSTVCLSSKKVMNYISSSCCSTTNLDKCECVFSSKLFSKLFSKLLDGLSARLNHLLPIVLVHFACFFYLE